MNVLKNNIRHYSNLSYIYHDINLFSKKSQTSINLNNLINYSDINDHKKIILASQFIHSEIPIRLAKKIKTLDSLPYEFYNNLYINKIREWYIDSFHDIKHFKYPTTYKDSINMKKITTKIYNRHSSTLITMANGINMLKKKNIDINNTQLQCFLNNFFKSRIGIRILLNHYNCTFTENNINTTGIINIKCCPYNIIKQVENDIIFICQNNNIDTPVININKNLVSFPYISSHLYYILFEILKNSVQANYDFNKNKNKIPDININIMNDNNFIIIKISDYGKGIQDHKKNKIWNYFYTTNNNFPKDIYDDFSVNLPLSGYGCGLPISKLYLNYFGGFLEICTKVNRGTDVYIILRLNGDFNEQLL